ncbi:hypothetical protein ACJRO7_022865 [Eucalyptus globulus]|uniref:Wax synthase domain-containing protein n=1 Tax=Eucalyptus globulus TaxID=34317 RepID=A0ABD3K999_EUCGL
MEEEARNFINVWLTVLSCVCYCYFISSSLPPGKLRLFSLLPIFSLFAALPLRLSTILPTGITSFFITYKGPLSSSLDSHPDPSKSFFLFILFTCFPIKIRQAQDYHGQPKRVLLLYPCMLYLYVDMILQMPSDEPYLSTSFQDFWGRRWNLTVTNAPQHTVYKPLKSFLEPHLWAAWATAAAVMAAFLVSGLMHELLYYDVTRARPTWEVTGFFVLQGACVVVEVVAKAAVGERWRLSRAVLTPLTVGFMAATAMWLFFPQLIWNGADARAIKECKAFVEGLRPKF